MHRHVSESARDSLGFRSTDVLGKSSSDIPGQYPRRYCVPWEGVWEKSLLGHLRRPENPASEAPSHSMSSILAE